MAETPRELLGEEPDLDLAPRPGTVRLATWGPGPFAPSTFTAEQRAAVLALLRRTDVVAVGALAAAVAEPEALIAEAGPQYQFRRPRRCPTGRRPPCSSTRGGCGRAARPTWQEGRAQMPGWADPRPYLTEFQPHCAAKGD